MENSEASTTSLLVDKEKETDKKPQRVVSLLGASTETVYRLGLGSILVGRSHECDYPPLCLSLPCISRPRFDPETSSSKEIDDAVRYHSANGNAIYRLDSDIISQLQPDLIIAQDHCRVCAITPDDMKNSETCMNVPQIIVKPSTLQDCFDNIETIACGLGYPERGRKLKETLEHRLDQVREVVATTTATSNNNNNRPNVALLEWCDPLMGCGYWLPELVSAAGGNPLHCPPPGGATPSISFSTLMDSKPDVIIFALCGFGLTRAAKELVQSWGNEKLQKLKNTLNGRVFVVDGNNLVNRSGPRVVESAEVMAEAIHPHLLGHFGHYGTEMMCTLEDAMSLVEAGVETGSTKVRPVPFTDDSTFLSEEEPLSNKSKLHQSAPSCTADKVVSEQIQHLRKNEFPLAFALNSTANQARWCSPDQFTAILRSHSDFQRLLSDDEPAPQIGEVQQTNNNGRSSNIATVEITLNPTNTQPMVKLIWTMVIEESSVRNEDNSAAVCWKTEKVGLVP